MARSGVDGRQLMDDVAGTQVMDDKLHRGFIQELDILADEGYLTFTVESYSGNAEQTKRSYPYQYLQQVRNFALTVAGQDRARGVRVVQPLPDPDEDDGRLISGLVLQEIAEAIAGEYRPEQLLVFFDESGIPLDRIPLPEGTPRPGIDPGPYACAVLFGLDQWGSEGRRILRQFVGSWLDDRLVSGPYDELRESVVEKLARQGWYVQNGNLVVGEPAKGKRASSPVLRDARLSALHPKIIEVSGKLLKDGHRNAAVFEAIKAVHNRVQQMSALGSDGRALMSEAFTGETPKIALADLATKTGRDIQEGY